MTYTCFVCQANLVEGAGQETFMLYGQAEESDLHCPAGSGEMFLVLV